MIETDQSVAGRRNNSISRTCLRASWYRYLFSLSLSIYTQSHGNSFPDEKHGPLFWMDLSVILE
jgi:hypothetical protein